MKVFKFDVSHEFNKTLVEKESRQLKAASGEGVTKLIDFDTDSTITKISTSKSRPVCYIATELCTNGDLFDLISEGPLPQKICRTFATQIAETLSALHGKGISHRDLKPENILFDADGNAKLCDFGFSSSAKLNKTN